MLMVFWLIVLKKRAKGINVSKAYFNYEFGTGSFISKDNNQSFNSLIIDIKDCRLNDE